MTGNFEDKIEDLQPDQDAVDQVRGGGGGATINPPSGGSPNGQGQGSGGGSGLPSGPTTEKEQENNRRS